MELFGLEIESYQIGVRYSQIGLYIKSNKKGVYRSRYMYRIGLYYKLIYQVHLNVKYCLQIQTVWCYFERNIYCINIMESKNKFIFMYCNYKIWIFLVGLFHLNYKQFTILFSIYMNLFYNTQEIKFNAIKSYFLKKLKKKITLLF